MNLLPMKSLNFTDAIEYCKKNKCKAFALNEKEYEIFVIAFYTEDDENEDFTEVLIEYSKDLSDLSGDENCSVGIEDSLDLDEAIEECPHIHNLDFYPFDYEEDDYYGLNYFGAKEILLKHLNG